MPRPVKPSGGRTFSKTCVIRGREAEGRKAILVMKRDHTRIAAIGPDGLTLDGSEKVPTPEVLDVRPIAAPAGAPQGPIPGVIGDRGTLTIPSRVRRRYRLPAGSPVLIEEREDGFFIRPAEIGPRPAGPSPTLEGLLAGVTLANLHAEVDTGPAIGGEAL